MHKIILLFASLLFCGTGICQRSQPIDWAKFLSRSDLIYDTLTAQWEDGVFTGNGSVGTMLYMNDSSSLRIEIGNSYVVDHRTDSISNLYGKARLPIGHFNIKPLGKIVKNTAHLDLWNAEATGIMITEAGTIRWQLLTLSQTDVSIFKAITTGSERLNISFTPEESISSRVKYSKDVPAGYTANPPYVLNSKNNISYCRQPMLAGGDYTTAWESVVHDRQSATYISVGINNTGTSTNTVLRAVETAIHTPVQILLDRHRNWWHNYYPQSFLSIPDARTESFYWIQQYKIASTARVGKRPIDLMGPWYRYTPWPSYWFNLNIQLTYSPMYTANRLDMAEGLVDMLDHATKTLKQNVPEPYQYNSMAVSRSAGVDLYGPVKVYPTRNASASASEMELGNLTWMLYYYWLHYRYTMDPVLKDKLIPLLKQSINYYLNIMQKGNDGQWHLPYTYSPEYPRGTTRDCNYDLSLFRWGCETLLQLSPQDTLAYKWKDVINNLTPYPKDENGFRIGADVAFDQSHRHFSHLLMIYPLHIMNLDQKENSELIDKSLQHWHGFKDALQGYSFTGGASIYAMMGNGGKAINCLNRLFDHFVKPSTMYLETGPVIETPLAAATSIQELLLQSWGGKIRVFPAVPQSWRDAAFENLRTDGAFLISAVRRNGKTKWIHIKSLVGGYCTLKTDFNGKIKTKGSRIKILQEGNGEISFRLRKADEFILYSKVGDLGIPLSQVPSVGKANYWGRK